MNADPALISRAPHWLAISDRPQLLKREGDTCLEAWFRWLKALTEAGVDSLQLREKDLGAAALLQLAKALRPRWPGRLLVNGRLDVALAADADGVHLPAAEIPVGSLRRRFGPRPILGVSTHHPDEVKRAAQAGADYVTFGPIFPTPSKMRYGAPPGLEELRGAAEVGLPVIALGGVNAENMPEVLAAGAIGIAGIRAFYEDASLERLSAGAKR